MVVFKLFFNVENILLCSECLNVLSLKVLINYEQIYLADILAKHFNFNLFRLDNWSFSIGLAKKMGVAWPTNFFYKNQGKHAAKYLCKTIVEWNLIQINSKFKKKN